LAADGFSRPSAAIRTKAKQMNYITIVLNRGLIYLFDLESNELKSAPTLTNREIVTGNRKERKGFYYK